MANLKELKTRISSVNSTQKITSAMKMVAASRLRRAQDAAVAARPYAERMERMIAAILDGTSSVEGGPKLLAGTGSDQTHMIVACTSDRGLCGGFNSSITREVRSRIAALEDDGKTVKLFCVGRKARDLLRRDHGDKIVKTVEGIGRTVVTLENARDVTAGILELLDAEEFDLCTVIYNRFVSAITQIVTRQQIIPMSMAPRKAGEDDAVTEPTSAVVAVVYEYEPDEKDILASLLPKNLEVQIFRALLESNASEHGARMSAMDNATRNAGDMIDDLTLTYNRTRQALITRELIEIISGAEAL